MAAIPRLPARFVYSFKVAIRSLATVSVSRNTYAEWSENSPMAYQRFVSDKLKFLQAWLENPKRFQRITDREERSELQAPSARALMTGKCNQLYRGVAMLKMPLDMAIYTQMFWLVKPRTVIEIGVCAGGSVLWIADTINAMKIDCNIFGVDIDLSLLNPLVKDVKPKNVTFLESDSEHIDRVFPSGFLENLPHPIIIIDDAHEGFEVALTYFDSYFIPGDYIVCEDTSPDVAKLGHTNDDSGGFVAAGIFKLREWTKYIAKQGEKYAVDSFYTDYFGYNVTGNWNGYVRKMK